jgi:branched-chain amino acid transport system substrate-binding protein
MLESSSSAVSRRTILKSAAAIAGAGASVALLASCLPEVVSIPALGQQVPPRGADAATLQIGVLLPSAGAYSRPVGGLMAGLQLGFAAVDGQVAGRRIELLVEQEGGPPAERAATLRRFFAAAHVPVIVGAVSSAAGGAVGNYLRSGQGVVMLRAIAGGEDLVEGRDPPAFQLAFTPWQLSFPLGEWVYYNLAHRVYVTATDTPFGRRSAEAFSRGFARAGVAVAGESYVAAGELDFTEELSRIGRARAEATYACYTGAQAVAFVRQYAAAGLARDVRLVGPGLLSEEELLSDQGTAALGAISSLHWTPALDLPENLRFREAYRQRYGHEPDLLALHGYDAARVLTDALQQVGGDTSSGRRLQEAVAGVRIRSPRGPFRFDPEGRAPVQDIYIRDVKDQKGILGNVVLETAHSVRDPGRTVQGG